MGGGVTWSCYLLLSFSLEGVLAGDWSVSLPSGPICAGIGSSVVLPCSYEYPNETGLSAQNEEQEVKVLSELWCLEDSRCITPSYVFHSDNIFPDPSYQSRVQYLGQPGTNNCTLRISDVRPSDSGTYVFYLITSHPTEKMPGQSGVQLLVAESSKAVSVLASPSRAPAEGSPLRLACCGPAAGPQATFSWYESSRLTHSGQVWNISTVTSAQSGSFYCQMHTGQKLQNSSVLEIDVQYSPRNTSVSVWPPGALHDHLPVNLTCSSDANPPVRTYTWYRDAACVPKADKSSHPGRHTTGTPAGRRGRTSASITVQEYGHHCCVARNSHGSQTGGVTLQSSKATAVPTVSAASKAMLIAVIIGVLLALIAIAAFLISRRRKSSTHQSYVLAPTTTQS